MRQKTSYAHCPPALEVERISKHSALLTFVENAAQVSAPDGAMAWEADAYTLVMPWQKDLYDLVEARYGDWIAHAKDREYEAEAERVRSRRDELLGKWDWTQHRNVPLSEDAVAAYAVYLQALRNIPEQPGFPWDVTWPEI